MRKANSLVRGGMMLFFFCTSFPAQQADARHAGSDAVGPPSVPGNDPPNFNAVALLRWYSANLTTAFTVERGPEGVVFDGANVGVTNFGSNNVTKLRASDGMVLGTFGVGYHPIALPFDGANIWMVNNFSANITKLRASDGTVLKTFVVGTSPLGIAVDGDNIWVTNNGDSTVAKLQASDGTVLGTFGAVTKLRAQFPKCKQRSLTSKQMASEN